MKHIQSIGAYFCLLAASTPVSDGCGTERRSSATGRRRLLLQLTASLFVVTICLCGCSSTYPVRYTTNGHLNDDLTGRRVTLERQEGEEEVATDVTIDNDSVSWHDAGTGEAHKVSIGKLTKIDIVKKNRLLGAVEWFCFGALGGAGVGWLSASSRSHGYNKEYGDVVVFGYGMIGAGIGLVTGLLVGHSNHYEFQLTEGKGSRRKTHIEKSSTKMDVLHLKNGDIVRGTILTEVGEDDYLRYVTIRNADGETLTYYGADIENVEREE